jgi:nitric oxide reductase NorD protein
MPERPGGLMLFRPESIFSWSEYAKVQHDVQENEEEDLARAADDLDTLSVSDDQRSVARALRMNLDRAARAEDAALAVATPAILLPEWDYKRQALLPDHCSLRISTPDNVSACELPERLRQEQRRLHHQLALLNPERQVRRRQSHGDEIDLDALIRARTDAGSGQQDCYQQVRRNQRDLSCLLLADLSLSTEAAISEELRVIDVIRDSLSLFAESLSETRDRFALYGFSSRQRHAVSMVELKRFDEGFDANIRGRIAQIKPAFYTRMGAAIRQSSALLAKEKSRERLLLILTDGKPNDNDYYEGRYGIEDTRYALSEARKQGLRPFCVTVDQTAEDYLPHIFGKHSFTIVKRPAELPRRLALLYAQLTR